MKAVSSSTARELSEVETQLPRSRDSPTKHETELSNMDC
ncbi:hypothetical protein NIES2111_04210 [Nostoc sp. NIES-2111]|nr:hypothetical protein NIES2111_04210 [Nostoc sp. NIES-2111]